MVHFDDGTATVGEREQRTRDRVARAVLEHGPVTAADIAVRLGVTPAAVRRHLDALDDAGRVVARDPRPTPTRGRGRPAREYVLTDAGHAAMTTAYDDLAASAMAFLAEQLGPSAVEQFAARRVAELEQRYAPVVAAAGPDVDARAAALADALARDGYAASTRPLGGDRAAAPTAPATTTPATTTAATTGPTRITRAAGWAATPAADRGLQLCQGHCPVQHVAERFPQLCDAETEVFSRLLGVHVQRLATLAGGAHVCTTHVPTPVGRAPVGRTAPAAPAREHRGATARSTTQDRTTPQHLPSEEGITR